MLKSTFKKVSAIAIAGTMLAGMMAVPANAMTYQPTGTVPYNATIISENFDSAALESYAMSPTTKTIPDITNISFSKVENWNDRRVSIIEDGTVHAMKFHTGDGVNLKIASPDGNTIPLQLGDKVNISFKFKYLTAPDEGKTDNTKLQLYLNDKTTSKTNFISTNNTGGWMESGTSDVGGITVFTPNNVGGYATNIYGAPTHSAGEWNTLNIVIDTQDVAKDNAQTIKTTLTKADDTTVYYYYKFDADYTGSDDETITPFSTLESLNFYANYTNGSEFCIDDVSVTVEGTRSHTEYVSDLSKVLLDENFDNVGAISSGNLQGTSFTVSKPWGANDFDVKNVNGAAQMKGGNRSTTTLLADVDDVVLGDDEVIRFSFDTTKSFGLYAGIRSTSITDPKVSLTSLDGKKTSSIPNDKGSLHIHHVTSEGYIRPGICQTVTDPMMLDGYTYHFEYTIDPSNRIYDNKQTLTVRVTSPDNALANSWQQDARFGEYKETLYLDADCNTEGVQKFDSLSAFYFKQYWNTTDVTIDNLKVEVLKPGFEVVNEDNHTNTWTFNSNDPIDLNYLVDANANSKVIVAQYADGGRMIDATTEDVAATGRDTITVTPNSTAKKIKAMVIDMNSAVPFAKVFVMTRQ